MGKNKPQTKPAALPSVEQYYFNLDTASAQSRALLAVKSRTVKIPANIRVAMQGLTKLAQWWAKNHATYAAAAKLGAAKTKRAGA